MLAPCIAPIVNRAPSPGDFIEGLVSLIGEILSGESLDTLVSLADVIDDLKASSKGTFFRTTRGFRTFGMSLGHDAPTTHTGQYLVLLVTPI